MRRPIRALAPGHPGGGPRPDRHLPCRAPPSSQEALGQSGRKDDPLFRVRKLLARGDERPDDRGRAKLLEALRVGDPNDDLLGAWLANRCAASTSSLIPPKRPCSSTTRSKAARQTTARRSARLAIPCRAGARRSWIIIAPARRTGPRRNELLREAGEARRSGHRQLLPLPAPRPPPRRWCHVADDHAPAPVPDHPPSPLKPEDPLFSRAFSSRQLQAPAQPDDASEDWPGSCRGRR